MPNLTVIRKHALHIRPGLSMAPYSGGGHIRYSLSFDRETYRHDLHTGAVERICHAPLLPSFDRYAALDLTPDGVVLLIAQSATCHPHVSLLVPGVGSVGKPVLLPQPFTDIDCVRFHPAGRHCICIGVDNERSISGVQCVDLQNPQRGWFREIPGVVCSAAFSPDGRCFGMHRTCTSGQSRFVLLDSEGNQLIDRYQDFWRPDYMSFTPDMRWMVSASDTTFRVWSVQTGVESSYKTQARICGLTITPDAHWCITSHNDAEVRLWRLDDGELAPAARLNVGRYAGLISGVNSDMRFLCELPDREIATVEIGDAPPRAALVTAGIGYHLRCAPLPPRGEPNPFPHGIITHDTMCTARCGWCGAGIVLPANARAAIDQAAANPQKIPAMELDNSAWADPRLGSHCGTCGFAVRFNPFLFCAPASTETLPWAE